MRDIHLSLSCIKKITISSCVLATLATMTRLDKLEEASKENVIELDVFSVHFN